jgi:DNA processing protein
MINDPYDYLRISMLPGIGPARGRALLTRFGSFATLLRAKRGDLVKVDGFQLQLAQALLAAIVDERNSGAIEKNTTHNIDLCTRYGYRFISCDDATYPALLKGIYDPPLYLFSRGTFTESDNRAAAIVGTRHPSEYGRQVAEHFAAGLARDGVTVVSGLALGVDTVAHRSALAAGGRSIAVMGSGLRRVYPSSNRELAAGIAENGCVLSELPLETAPDAMNFPRRNRIISGLSRCLIVAESAERGGAMISAQLALDQGRDVFAVPGSIFNTKSAGPHLLLRKSMARPATSTEDLYQELPSLRSRTASRVHTASVQLSLIEQQIADLLGHEPLHIDEIAARTGLTLPSLLVDLLQMEFKEIVRQLPGKHFVRGSALI